MRAPCFLLLAAACSAAAPAPPEIPVGLGVGAGGTRAPPSQPGPPRPVAVGRIESVELNEISGIVESRRSPGVFFVHNDSGDSARLFAIDRAGSTLAELKLEPVPLLIDAEDIALGPGPNGQSFLYLGDTGNNFASMGLGIPRRKAVLYRFDEPQLALTGHDAKVSIREVFPITFTFPNGARDVEAFFVDPLSGYLFMISKQGDGHSQLLSASPEQLAGGGGELRLETELVFGQGSLPGNPMPTAASISRDGLAILIRTYSSVFLFRREPGDAVTAALSRPPRQLPSPREQQGESIGFADQDAAFITISEGVNPAVNCASLAP